MDWLLWIDLETTGLDCNDCSILQIGCVLTNMDASHQLPMHEITLQCDKLKLDSMNEWCKKQHTESGLLKQIESGNGCTLKSAEQQICLHLNNHVRVKDTIFLAGNSVHFDKGFIDKWMPSVASRISHRIVDISSLALICKSLNPHVYHFRPSKTNRHTALSDIAESIYEYQYYLATFVRTQTIKN